MFNNFYRPVETHFSYMLEPYWFWKVQKTILTVNQKDSEMKKDGCIAEKRFPW